MHQPSMPCFWPFASTTIRIKATDLRKTGSLVTPVFEQGQAVADGSYEVLSYQTSGKFASVWLAKDISKGNNVVIKAVNAKDHGSLADNEQHLLQHLGTSAIQNRKQSQSLPASSPATTTAPPSPITSPSPPHHANASQPRCAPGIIQLLSTFLHTLPNGQQYKCLVLERLGNTAAEVLAYLSNRSKTRARRGMNTAALKNMTRQLLIALDHCHSNGIIHRDIKPGNIMTSQPLLAPSYTAPSPAHSSHPQHQGNLKAMSSAQLASCTWKLIDFGIACKTLNPNHQHPLHQTLSHMAHKLGFKPQTQDALYYDTPAYAPPEAILLLPVTPAYDMWSLGCVIYEMATGHKLFAPAVNGKHSASAVHLYQMACLLGSPPRSLLIKSNVASEYFDHKGALHIETDVGLRMCSLYDVLSGAMDMPESKARDLSGFLEPLLVYDPAERASAGQMLGHPWLAG